MKGNTRFLLYAAIVRYLRQNNIIFSARTVDYFLSEYSFYVYNFNDAWNKQLCSHRNNYYCPGKAVIPKVHKMDRIVITVIE